MYLEMYSKPENGDEIYNAACRRSGIMVRLRFIKSVRNEADQEYD